MDAKQQAEIGNMLADIRSPKSSPVLPRKWSGSNRHGNTHSSPSFSPVPSTSNPNHNPQQSFDLPVPDSWDDIDTGEEAEQSVKEEPMEESAKKKYKQEDNETKYAPAIPTDVTLDFIPLEAAAGAGMSEYDPSMIESDSDTAEEDNGMEPTPDDKDVIVIDDDDDEMEVVDLQELKQAGESDFMFEFRAHKDANRLLSTVGKCTSTSLFSFSCIGNQPHLFSPSILYLINIYCDR